jgi:hypothetical protein
MNPIPTKQANTGRSKRRFCTLLFLSELQRHQLGSCFKGSLLLTLAHHKPHTNQTGEHTHEGPKTLHVIFSFPSLRVLPCVQPELGDRPPALVESLGPATRHDDRLLGIRGASTATTRCAGFGGLGALLIVLEKLGESRIGGILYL